MNDSSKPLNDLQNSIISKSTELMRRKAITYTFLEEIYVKHGFSESNGTLNLINKVRNSDGLVGVDLEGLDKDISKLLLNHLKFNDKSFNMYYIKDVSYLNDLYDKLKKDALDETEFDFEIGEENTVYHGPMIESDDFSIFYFQTSRYFFHKDEIKTGEQNKKTYSDNINGELVDLYGKWKIRINCYDFIALDFKHNLLVVGFDLGSLFKKPEIALTKEKLEKIINKKNHLGLMTEINFYPCLKKMHDEIDTAGNLVGNIIGQRMLTFEGENVSAFSPSTNTDLRVGGYHAAGSKAVKSLDFHVIYKMYSVGSSKPVIMIKEDLRILRKLSTKAIYYALVNNLNSIHDLRFCFKKLLDLS